MTHDLKGPCCTRSGLRQLKVDVLILFCLMLTFNLSLTSTEKKKASMIYPSRHIRGLSGVFSLQSPSPLENCLLKLKPGQFLCVAHRVPSCLE